jgi:branched-chain amino acid transport system substrate-binding protein
VRKTIVFSLVVFVVLVSILLTGCQPAKAPSGAGTIKIGHIRPLTGHMAIAGQRMVKGAQLAFEEANYQVAGKKIELIVEDDAAEAEKAIDKARKLVEQDKVALILGPTVGGPQMAVSAYLNKAGIPCIHTNPSPVGVIMEKHQWTIQAGSAEPQEPSCMARYAYEQKGIKKVTVITSDFAPGHGFLNAFMATFKKLGGQVIQEQYPPMANPDYAPYLSAIKDADACVAWMDGTDAIKFLTQYEEFGMWKRMPIIPAFHGSFFAPFLIGALPPKAAAPIFGQLAPTPYSTLLDNATNKKFVANFIKRFQNTPEETESGPYTGALLVLAALKATNGDTTPAKLKQAILDLQIEGPEGPIRFDKEKMSAIRNMYISTIEKVGNDIVWKPIYTYKDVPPLGF